MPQLQFRNPETGLEVVVAAVIESLLVGVSVLLSAPGPVTLSVIAVGIVLTAYICWAALYIFRADGHYPNAETVDRSLYGRR